MPTESALNKKLVFDIRKIALRSLLRSTGTCGTSHFIEKMCALPNAHVRKISKWLLANFRAVRNFTKCRKNWFTSFFGI